MLLSWRVFSTETPDTTFCTLFSEKLKPSISHECELERVYVGRDKVCLDETDMNLNVGQVTSMFGSFIKYTVQSVQNSTSPTVQLHIRNAFEIMLQSQQRLEMQKLLARVHNPVNRKQKLRNDIIDLLDQNDMVFKHSEAGCIGEQIVQALTNILWYVDGHHEVLKSRACEVPSVFNGFVGYNVREMSKHRKRHVGHMSSEVLQQHAKQLFLCLQAPYWERPHWQPFRNDVETLARSLTEYASYLSEKNKQMKMVHGQLQPIRDIGDHLSFMFLPVASNTAFITFQNLEQALQAKECYQSVQITEFAPHETSKRYDYIKKLKRCGLPFPCAMLTYSHGNNIGNLNFIWRVDDKGENGFTRSQSEIEHIKNMLPVFKTRAMRRAAFRRFGRLTPKLSSVAFNYMYKELTGDQSAAKNIDQAEIERRVKMIVDMEDVDAIIDLRHLNSGRKGIYDVFWQECSKFLQEGIGQAVDDRRHQEVTHLATAISVPDLISQVQWTS